MAAGQFTREAIAVVKNRQFIEFCERVGDRETAALYRDRSSPTSGTTTSWATAAAPLRGIGRSSGRGDRGGPPHAAMAEELQQKALATVGIHHVPGC